MRLPGRFLLCLLSLAAAATGKPPVAPPDPFAAATPAEVPALYRPLWQGFLEEAEAASFRAALPYDRITLERTPCFGSCPAYTVTFHRSGRATLQSKGGTGMPLKGDFVGEIDLFAYARLCYALDHFQFRNFREDYRATWTDDTSAIVTAAGPSGEKRVSDYGSVGPMELWTIQQILDAARGRIVWKPAP